MIPTGLQDWIYKLEEGEGAKYLKVALAFLLLAGLAAIYDIREFSDFKNPEAMEAAQLARNIANGKGFTTQCIRPFAVALLQKKSGGTAVLKQDVPDITNPPVFPWLLAGWMKVVTLKPEIVNPQNFSRYQPEVMIALLNQGLFLIAILLLFPLAKQLFDATVAWISALAFATTELFWRFSVSGLSTMLLIVLFLGLAHLLLAMERGVREQTASTGKLIGLAIAVGFILGVSALTRYAITWLIIPVTGFLLWVGGTRRFVLGSIPLIVLLACLAPWMQRNYALCGAPFGTATYAVYQETAAFPGNRLDRTMPRNLEAELDKVGFTQIFKKLVVGTADNLQNGIPKLGESWLAAFFLVSLLITFKNDGLKRFRWFLVGTLLVLVAAQALGKTYFTTMNPVVNSENLLAVVAPVAFIFGTAMFMILLDAIEWPIPPLRSAAIAAFLLVLAAPLIFLLSPPREWPVSYPPYLPPLIQETAGWLKDDELMMSDMPWGVAWYGNRKCLLVTLDAGTDPQGDFFTLNDYQKPIQALFLSPLTMDSRFLTEMIRGKEGIWGKFVLESLLKTNVPTGFPLKQAPRGLLPDHLFLSDRNRAPRTSK